MTMSNCNNTCIVPPTVAYLFKGVIGATGVTGATGVVGPTGPMPSITGTTDQIGVTGASGSYSLYLPPNVTINHDYTGRSYQNRVTNVLYGASSTIDLAAGDRQILILIGDTLMQVSNIVAGKTVVILVNSGASSRNIGFAPNWQWLPSRIPPSTIAANTTALLTLTCWTALDTGITAEWTVQS
jgi:hypothetical protein